MKVTKTNQTVKASTLKKKTVRLNALTITDAEGDLSFDGGYLYTFDDEAEDDRMNKKISIDEKTGEIVLKKGTYPKGTIKVLVEVEVFSRGEYDHAYESKKIKIKIV